jgi:deoxyribose-phosphate aldolase
MLNETLGSKWMTNEWFRFGASSLANDILLQLGKEKYNGVYYSKDYISLD